MNPSLKVAQPGWNINTAPDWALVFNSAWPSLQIAFEQTVTSSEYKVTHNLGFPPLAFAWYTYNGINYGRIGSLLQSDSVQCYLDLGGIGLPSSAIITVRCYNIDVSKEASYPLPVSAAAKTAPDLKTGIKIVKTGRSINSPNLNDFILNSTAQSPAVLEVATQGGQYYNTEGSNPGGMQIQYPLSTSYIPWVTGVVSFGDPGENGEYVYYPTNALTYNVNQNSLSLPFGEVGTGASLIILRDPLFYPNTVRVVY